MCVLFSMLKPDSIALFTHCLPYWKLMDFIVNKDVEIFFIKHDRYRLGLSYSCPIIIPSSKLACINISFCSVQLALFNSK